MPRNLSADQFFKKGTDKYNILLNKFLTEVMNPRTDKGKSLTQVSSAFTPEHDRLFILEQENDQWVRIPLSQKFGPDLFSVNKMIHTNPDAIHQIYDLVEQGKLFFYNRGSDVPMQFKHIAIEHNDTEEEREPTYKVQLEVVEEDIRLESINAQRAEQAKTEEARFKQYQASVREQSVVKDFASANGAAGMVDTIENARNRAHNTLSLDNPGILPYGNDPAYAFKPRSVPSGSRFTPQEMETIVLAACSSIEAVATSANPQDKGLTGEEKQLGAVNTGIHTDMLIVGRTGALEAVGPVFEKGREMASEALLLDAAGDQTKLKEIMMNGLRSHIQAAREGPSLGPTLLRIYEETEKMVRLIDRCHLCDDLDMFKPLADEARAMGETARIYMNGAKACQELLEAYKAGGFESEEQRLSIISRIEAQRYITAQDAKSAIIRDQSPENQEIQKQRMENDAALRENKISEEEHHINDGRLLAKRGMLAPRRTQIQECMDLSKASIDLASRFQDYGLLSDEGQALSQCQTPFQMIDALRNLPRLTDAHKDNVNALLQDVHNKMATKMDTTAAQKFWQQIERSMGNSQFDPEKMPSDFNRLVVQSVDAKGNISVQPLMAALGHPDKKNMNVASLEDAALMEQVRDQIAQGNVFFFNRGQNVPRRISLDENENPAISAEAVTAPNPGLLARIIYYITGGRFFKEEVEQYNQESYFLKEETLAQNATRSQNEIEDYAATIAQSAARKNKETFVSEAPGVYWNMADVMDRAHKILSLDNPGTVTFMGETPDYKGISHTIPESVKNTFSPEELDALCLAGITSSAAAKAHMEAGVSTVVGSTPKSTANALEGHIFDDILVAGRMSSDRFFPLVNAGRQEAANALNAFANNDPKQMAQLLGESIHSAVLSGRFDLGVKSSTTLYSEMALRMVSMLEKNPQLKDNCGIDAETLEGYKQELTSLRMIGEAYNRAGAAYRQLADAAREDRTLTEPERQAIASDLLTYHYLNGLQLKDNDRVASSPEILGMSMILSQNSMVQLDQNGNRINPLVPGEGQIPTREYYLNAVEGRDLTLDIKNLYTTPLPSVKALSETTLDQIREHVMASPQAKDLVALSDPMAFHKTFKKQIDTNRISELINNVSASRKKAVFSQQEKVYNDLLEQANMLTSAEKGAASQQDPQPQKQDNPLAMN